MTPSFITVSKAKPPLITVITISLAFIIGSVTLNSAQGQSIDQETAGQTKTHRRLHAGVNHWSISDCRGPWKLNIVEIELGHTELVIESARANDKMHGRERLSSIVHRLQAPQRNIVAAINADFFNLNTGENLNNQIIQGEFVKGTRKTNLSFDTHAPIRSQFALSSDRRPMIEQFGFSGWVMRKDGTRDALAGVNVALPESSMVFHNSYLAEMTAPKSVSEGEMEILLQPARALSDTLFLLASGEWQPAGSSTLSSGSWRLRVSEHKDVITQIRVDDTVITWLGTDPYVGPLRTLVGGWPMIVRNGTNLAAQTDTLEGVARLFSTQRHPRTGIGFSEDSSRVFLVTVDGRQSTSVGMTLSEFGEAMLSIGIWNGLNLDGGGSTTMVVNDVVVNSPSDPTGERPIANGILVVAEVPDSRPQSKP